jgi:hypothetical protein
MGMCAYSGCKKPCRRMLARFRVVPPALRSRVVWWISFAGRRSAGGRPYPENCVFLKKYDAVHVFTVVQDLEMGLSPVKLARAARFNLIYSKK